MVPGIKWKFFHLICEAEKPQTVRGQLSDAVRHAAPHRSVAATRFGRRRIGLNRGGEWCLYSDLRRGRQLSVCAHVVCSGGLRGEKMNKNLLKTTIRHWVRIICQTLKNREVIRFAFRLLYWLITGGWN